jgi:ABC-type lipoprotein release transport system permease subunit
LQPPWLHILITLGACFGLWMLYLLLPTLARSVRLLANLLGRRADKRTLTWIAIATLAVAAVAGSIEYVLGRLHPEVQYYVFTAVQLVVVVLGVLAVVAFITWFTLFAFALAGRPLLTRGYLVFVGWHLLKSHRAMHHGIREYEGGRPPHWLMAVLSGAICLAAAFAAGRVPWARWVGNLTVMIPALRVALVVMAGILLTWPLRRGRPVGSVDIFDRLEARVKNLPDLLTVTLTTFISIVGVGVGVWALIVVLSVMSGFENDLRSKILATNPHVVIQDEEPMEGIPSFQAKLRELRAIEGVLEAIPYVQGDVIVTSRENRNVSLTLRGIDPEDLSNSEHHLGGALVAGTLGNLLAPERIVPTARWNLRQIVDENTSPELDPDLDDDPDDLDDLNPIPIPGVDTPSPGLEEGLRPGIILGEELANSLRVSVGGEVTVVSPRDDAGFLGTQPRARTFRVAAVFNTGMYEFDLKLAYVRLSEAQRFFHMGPDVNRIELRLADVDQSQSVVDAIGPLLDAPSLEARDWKALNKNLFSALALEKLVMFIVLGFIILVASFNVIGSLVMIIMEKTREIAVLKSMGATSREVRRIFLVLGAFIGGIGSAAGLLVGLMTCGFIQYVGIQLPRQYYIEKLPVHVDPATIAVIFCAGILLCLLATLYPAAEAARIDPVEGLRFD